MAAAAPVRNCVENQPPRDHRRDAVSRRREGVSFVFECVHGMKKDRYGGTGAILADDMGLGKTLQSITLMYSLLKNKDSQGKPLAKRCIVVCPCSLVKNWEDEFEKWINSKAHDKNERVECMALSDTSRKTVEGMIDQFLSPACYYDVLVISYETFRAQHQRFARKKDSADIIVCDEAHRLKNDEAQTSQALASLACRKRVLLSGTPMQNDLVEFFAMSNFTNPGGAFRGVLLLRASSPSFDSEAVRTASRDITARRRRRRVPRAQSSARRTSSRSTTRAPSSGEENRTPPTSKRSSARRGRRSCPT